MDHALTALRAALGDRAREGERLAPHTTFRIGGPADLFAEARTIEDLVAFAKACREHGVPFFVLGKGSNLLVLDGGIRGLVVENRCGAFELHVTNTEQAVLNVESGASLPGTANRLARQGWSGLEWAIGVPATFGGALVGNAGAHGGSIGDNVRSVTALDAGGAVRRLHKNECGFEYRSSCFRRSGQVVLSAEFELRRDDPKLCI
ncbi:MAG: FAD-binding protein, partial [Chloroflexi bacterium]|nr:FAD-binding protein [Chloroflexota bacterium]